MTEQEIIEELQKLEPLLESRIKTKADTDRELYSLEQAHKRWSEDLWERTRKEIQKSNEAIDPIRKRQQEMGRNLRGIMEKVEELKKALRHHKRRRAYNFLKGKRLQTPLPMVSG